MLGPIAVHGLSLVVASGGYSSLRCAGSRHAGFSSCGSRGAECRLVVVAHRLSCSAARGIFRTRAWTRVPCIGRRILNHCATREAQTYINLICKTYTLIKYRNRLALKESIILCIYYSYFWEVLSFVPNINRLFSLAWVLWFSTVENFPIKTMLKIMVFYLIKADICK